MSIISPEWDLEAGPRPTISVEVAARMLGLDTEAVHALADAGEIRYAEANGYLCLTSVYDYPAAS